jgi:acetyl esterase/lipase
MVGAVAVIAVVAVPTPDGQEAGAPVERDLAYLGSGGPTLDVHRAEGASSARPAVMVIHGGGWIARDKKWTAPLARRLARAGFVAVNVNFTLAGPGRPGFPRQPRELRAALRFIRANAADLGIDPERIGAYGSSTGAHLAALIATTGRGPLGEGGRVRAAVAWGGVYRLRNFQGPARFGKRIAAFLGCRRCPRRAGAGSPLRHAGRGDPAMMIVHSRRETIPLVQAKRMSRRLRRKGIPRRFRVLPGKAHLPLESPRAFRQTVSFLSRRLG